MLMEHSAQEPARGSADSASLTIKEPEVRGPEDTDIPPTHRGGGWEGTIHSTSVGGLSCLAAFSVTQGEIAVGPGLQQGLKLPLLHHVHGWFFLSWDFGTMFPRRKLYTSPSTIWVYVRLILNEYMHVCLCAHHSCSP